MNGGFIFNNILSNSIIAADSYIEGYEPELLKNGIPADTFKASSQTAVISVDLLNVLNFTGFALINSNITAATLKLYSDETTLAESIPLTDQIIDQGGYKNLYMFFPEKNYRYFKIECSSSENIEIGEIYMGETWIFSRNYNWGFVPLFKVNKNAEVVNGQLIYSEGEVTEQNGFQLSFTALSHDQTNKFRTLLKNKQSVFIPDFSEASCYHGGLIAESLSFKREDTGASTSIEFMENAICTG